MYVVGIGVISFSVIFRKTETDVDNTTMEKSDKNNF